MYTFLKAQVASFAASTVDYLCTILCVEALGFWVVWASSLGTIAGGFTNFSIGRRWVFSARDEKASIQMVRYGVVWLGYLSLTTLCMYLITHFTGMNYLIAKMLVSLAMAVFYNYPLQKRYVFA